MAEQCANNFPTSELRSNFYKLLQLVPNRNKLSVLVFQSSFYRCDQGRIKILIFDP